jgi:hypothetical protein
MHYKDFHRAGFRVFPLHGADSEGNCECGNPECKMPYKHPRSAGWQKTPLWSSEQLELMEETGQFTTGYGVLCSGLIVVDVDARNGGLDSLAKLPIDLDNAGLIVATGSGGGSRHFYFRAPEGVSLVHHLPQFPGIDFKSSGFVVGPGSRHISGKTYTLIDGNVDDIEEAPAALVDLLRRPERHRTEYNGAPMDVSHDDIAAMLGYINGTEMHYDEWIKVGMAIHHSLGGHGYDLWDAWSQKSPKYDATGMDHKWHSFGKSSNPVTIGTLIHYAEQGGWKQQVTFDLDPQTYSELVGECDLLDTSHVDLLRPPGFVGQLCEWINSQCLYPREHLAVMASIMAMGNISGLRYTDDLSGVTANLFGFGVAESGTGKDSVFKAFNDVMRAAGLSKALYGHQKSSKEVVVNLTRHQASFYNIDEFGIQLKKAVNSSKTNATHLEDMIGILMNAYSKADGFFPVSGDMKEEIQEKLRRRIAYCRKAIAENEDRTGSIARELVQLEFSLAQSENGIDRPFVSIMGSTTPSTFDELVTPDQAKSGFIGRAIIVRELEANPLPKENFKKSEMPERMAMYLYTLAHGGEFDQTKERIDYYGERVKIKTDDHAKEALGMVQRHFWQLAEDQKEITDLTPIPRRGYEMVSKISLILAVPSGVRTLEHVQWAYAFVKRDIDAKLKLVMSNDKTYGPARVLMAKITNIISDEHGETFGVICNRLRSYKKEDVASALNLMETARAARKEVTKHPRSGKPVERWFLL